ncbi:phenylalanine--tRNA ligase subunit beta, partial [Thermodesulfobacteriota bacterium]
DIYPDKHDPPVINLRIRNTNDFLGSSISKDEMISYLKALQMSVEEKDGDTIEVIPPSYRVDLSREIDLVEEVARMSGYDNIPVTYPHIKPYAEDDIPSLIFHDRVCETLAGIGFSEIVTYSFISPDSADLLCAKQDSEIRSFVNLMNPLTTEQSVMRTSLLPGLISTVKDNMAHGEPNLKLFEWGKVYIRDDSSELPVEKLVLSGIMSGNYNSKKWYNEPRPVDFYDIKGAVEVLLRSAGLLNYSFEKRNTPEAYNEDYSCCLRAGDAAVGYIGKINSDVLIRYDIKSDDLYIFEIDVANLISEISKNRFKYEPYAKYPAVFRDITIIVDKKVESDTILSIIRNEGGGLVESADLFGVYEGKKLGENKKSLSYRICYRSDRETLDGDLVNNLNEKIIESIMDETGGTLSEG